MPSGDVRGEDRLAAMWSSLQTRWPENRIEPTLDRIRALCELMGDPQTAYPVVHVAGTNGKTSTARMVESLLRASGLRTGLFTSPHLIDPRERICLDGDPVDAERLLAAWDEVRLFVEAVDAMSASQDGVPLSFFEVMTGLAFAVFADAPVDVAIIEVGLGGEWDSTNVVDGAVCVVTPIGMDHMEYLGDTLALVAQQKAGIIGPGTVAVLAVQEPAAVEVLLARCADVGAEVAREGVEFGVLSRDVAVGGQVLALRGLHGVYEEVLLPLFGAHQAGNAAVALAATEAFLGGVGRLEDEVVREGFASVTSPGRLQVVRRSPTIVVDAAHNPHGARALAAAIEDSFQFASLVGVVGVLEGKDAAGVLEALDPVVSSVVVTAPSSPRALPADDLAAIAVDVLGSERVVVEPRLDDAIDRAVSLAEEDEPYGAGVLVTGSVVLVGDAMRLLS